MILQISDERVESKVMEEEDAELTCPCGHIKNTITCGRIHTVTGDAIRYERCMQQNQVGRERKVRLGPAVLGECQR